MEAKKQKKTEKGVGGRGGWMISFRGRGSGGGATSPSLLPGNYPASRKEDFRDDHQGPVAKSDRGAGLPAQPLIASSLNR